HGVVECVEINASQSLDQMKTIGVGQGVAIHPGAFVETDSIDDQCVLFSVSDRVTIVARDQILVGGMRTPIHIDGVETGGTTVVQDINMSVIPQIQDLEPIGRCPETRAW